ncbi:FHIPEP family type III secretion protein [Pseudenhygromyxa sp. WMMC2535]|uniref:FHIPEP family type III secretion protein n=1 Tax=Pseudenhygromyxa sp. WMMC2535 TaxID=2712867 RepID=UPI0015578888|nr:FHIPEP family type III secretion protein [Pseudenhygromyxa sp. WMMC2535]NVB37831.1 FHIPEP family type III secretion protein [Pseudenhygromyxa sp. WMMC2535]
MAALRVGPRALLRGLPGLAPAAVVVALIFCLLVPLPTTVVDLLLSLSLAGAVLVLVAGLRLRRTADFLGFPSLVLLLTSFRLVLNVSTTRLILVQGDAGRVVEAFARIVVRGDLIVGVVMFAVITAIQYFVIARGAERVAEVAARFALDGMPGQQAAIDADLRAGAIGAREAQARRAALAERADFFGRMDGVMRWVKGDAIVGLMITGINLVGGLGIGSSRDGLSVGESLVRYGELAIGDGLLAQLPALLIALAAALLVARVDKHRPRAELAWLAPEMLVVPAVLLGALAMVPGMPGLAFSTTAVGALALALFLGGRQGEADLRVEPRLRLSAAAGEGRAQSVDRQALERGLESLRRRCEQALAVAIPRFELEGTPAFIAGAELELRLGDRVIGREVVAGRADLDAVLLASFHALMSGAEHLVDLELIEAELERERQRRPALVRAALREVELTELLAIVRGLLRERVPAPSTEALLSAFAERRALRDPAERSRWLEHAREALADRWVRELCDGVAHLGAPRWLRPSADLEDLVISRSEARELGREHALHLGPAQRRRLLGEIHADAGRPTILVCGPEARPAFAALLAGARPHVPVLAISEVRAAKMELPATARLELLEHEDGAPW